MEQETIYHSEFSLVFPKSIGPITVNGALGAILGWMTAQGLSPKFSGYQGDGASLQFLIDISSDGKTLTLDLYGSFDPCSFASFFGFHVHEDEVYEGGDWCIRTDGADAYLATGARSHVVVQR